MRITSTTALALLAPLLSVAQDQQGPNAFIIPDPGLSFVAGESTTVEWDPTTDGTVTLILRSGSSNNLAEGSVIASEIDNSGSYTWTPDQDITRGSDYTLQIVSDDNPDETNYTPYFVVDSDNTVASVTGDATLGAPTQSAALPPTSTAQPTGSLTDFLSTATTTNMAESTMSDEDMTSEAAVATTTTATTTDADGSSVTSTVTTTATEDVSATGADAEETTGAGFQGQEDEDDADADESAATRLSAVVGLLGLVALGAFAL